VRDLNAGAIELAEMQAGIALAEHYSTEALRLSGSSQVSADLRLAQALLDWILTVWGKPVISLPDIYQRGIRCTPPTVCASRRSGRHPT
jgi:hypothetical protein